MILLFVALLVDRVFGDPDWLWRRVAHPVVGFGKIIDLFDGALGEDRSDTNKAFAYGVALVVALMLACLLVWGIVLGLYSVMGALGWLVELALVVILLAQKSLHDHVKTVADALEKDGIEAGRTAVSMIVGRNVSTLDTSGVSKAAVESLAENYSDGVVAPVFWYSVAGLPGILIYKAINTADSMVGHKTEKHLFFGRAAAKLDDWMNWPAARLSAALICVAIAMKTGGKRALTIFKTVMDEAPLHRSPNAGWPEASFAYGLGLTLGGPRSYGDTAIQAVAFNPTGRDKASPADIVSALALFERTGIVLWLLVALLLVFGF
ncbi:MAG: adenosylcobinamide-phosphate synthase CbiB [Pseudomonadota bacterium]